MLDVTVEPGMVVRSLWSGQARPEDAFTLMLVHGLEGNADVPYVRGMAALALARGWNVLRMNLRSCGTSEGLCASGYHNGQWADVGAVASEAVARFGLRHVGLCGYSMGGNMVLRQLGAWGASPPAWARAAVVVCPAADLAAASERLHLPFNRQYEWYFLQGLVRRVRRLNRRFPQMGLKVPRVPRSIFQFDDEVTAKMGGFTGAVDYYAQASAAPLLPGVTVPATILHAADDPFVPLVEAVRKAVTGNPALRLIAPARGGHCGFVSATQPRFWAEQRVVDLMAFQAQRTG